MYKKSRLAAAAAAILLGLTSVTGCSSGGSSASERLYKTGEKTTNANGEEVSVFDYTVTLNGEEIVFPVSRSELMSRGWVPDSDKAASGYYEKGGVRMLVRMCEKRGEDFTVNGMSLTNRNNSGVQFTLRTSLGAELNVSTKDDIEKIYGSPHKVWENGEYFYYEFGADKAEDLNMDRNCFGFSFDDDGIVRTIWITH